MSMIICKECGKEISDKANACPHCGCPVQTISTTQNNKNNSKKKNSALSIWAAVLGLFTYTCWLGGFLAIIDLLKRDKTKKHIGSGFAIFMCLIQLLVFSSNSSKTDDAENKNIKEVVSVENSETQSETSAEVSEEKETEVTVGNFFESNGLKVTLNDANTDFTDYDDEYGVYKPEDGYKYISASFTFENTGDSDRYVSIYDFDCYADGTLCEQSYNFGGDFINANISSGRNVSFDTYYVVPVESNSIELEYTSNIWTDEKVIIKIK